MSDTQFTRVDWRPGKRRKTRPRVQAYAGQKQAPAAFLAMALVVAKNPDRWPRICVKTKRDGAPCRSPAMTGAQYCWSHGGSRYAAKQRPYTPSKRGQRANAERSARGEPERKG